jgi:hypothetical protein
MDPKLINMVEGDSFPKDEYKMFLDNNEYKSWELGEISYEIDDPDKDTKSNEIDSDENVELTDIESEEKQESENSSSEGITKEYQKKEKPDRNSPLYLYYTSLYEENPRSEIAIKWLTEYGVYSDDKRDELIRRYKKYVKKGK